MNKEAQRIAISVAMKEHTRRTEMKRWSKSCDEEEVIILTDDNGNECIYWPTSQNQYDSGFIHPRHFLLDLNAMHEAIKILTPEQLWQMDAYLGGNCEVWLCSAEQVAEAFLRTLNLWHDNKGDKNE